MENSSPRATATAQSSQNASSIAKNYGVFIALAFGISWLIWILALRLGAGPGKGEEILAFGSVGPALAAILLSRSGRKSPTVSRPTRLLWFGPLWMLCWAIYMLSESMRGALPTSPWRFRFVVALLAAIPAWIGSGAFSSDAGVRDLLRTLIPSRNWRWPAVALLSFPAILLIPSAILHAFGFRLVWPQARGSVWILLASGALMFLRNLFFTAFFEEPGWRGYLLPHLQRKFSPLIASVLVWLPWAVWHAPLDFTGGVGRSLVSYVQVRVIFFIPIAIIMTWLYNRSGGNILSTAIFHAGMNTFPFILPYAAPALGLIFVWAGYAIIAEKMWRRRGPGVQVDADAYASATADRTPLPRTPS